MNEFIEQKKKEELRKIIFSSEFGWVDNHEWMMDGDKSVELLWKFFESALKASYKEGIRDAINICDEAIENDISGALRNRTWIRNKLQQLKEQQ